MPPARALARGDVVAERGAGEEQGPPLLSRWMSNGGTCPLAAPKSTIIPRGRSEASEASNVLLPTPS